MVFPYSSFLFSIPLKNDASRFHCNIHSRGLNRPSPGLEYTDDRDYKGKYYTQESGLTMGASTSLCQKFAYNI
jgi:hypothetical protein